MQTYSKPIRTLEDNEVFVFGSNEDGFHGAGAAGFAMLRESGNKWRETPVFGCGNLTLDKVPDGTQGYYAIKGMARGYQVGTAGRSYAICTVKKPGAKRSIPLENIAAQIKEMYAFARDNRDFWFIVASGVGKSLNGYSTEEMASAYACDVIPRNVSFQEDFWNNYLAPLVHVEKIINATGHRQMYIGGRYQYINNRNDPEYLHIVDAISGFLRYVHEKKNVNSFMSGMALGFDMAFAEAVVRLKSKGVPVRLIAMVPFKSQSSIWRAGSRVYYDWLLKWADEIDVRYPNPTNKAEAAEYLNKRNFDMIDVSHGVIAYYNGQKKGGTYNCMTAARKFEVPVMAMDPVSLKFSAYN